MQDDLQWARQQSWFYEFALPDGSTTCSYVPEAVRRIHHTRERALRHYLARSGPSWGTALDLACHEGYFSTVLAAHAASVTGIDRNRDSIDKAERICRLLGHRNIAFATAAVEDWTEAADFVLCFGLLYHVENPIQILRQLAALTRKALCIETQVLPFQMSGRIEDGSYQWQRDLQGLFGICVDYPERAEGGRTSIAMVPSRDAVTFLLRQFGFARIEVYDTAADDYEQFVRGSRIILMAER